MKKILWIFLAGIMIIILKDSTQRAKEYNQHVCQVYGYQADCKTKL